MSPDPEGPLLGHATVRQLQQLRDQVREQYDVVLTWDERRSWYSQAIEARLNGQALIGNKTVAHVRQMLDVMLQSPHTCGRCQGTTGSTVVGCVHAAWTHLHQLGVHTRYDDVEATYRRHSTDLAPLVGTADVWQRLAQLHQDDTAAQPQLFD